MLEQNMFSYIVWHLFHPLNENPILKSKKHYFIYSLADYQKLSSY